MNFKSLIELMVWNHHTIMPWFGYVAALLLVGLGPFWLIWAIRRAWHGLLALISRKKPSQKGHDPAGIRGGDGWVTLPPDFHAQVTKKE